MLVPIVKISSAIVAVHDERVIALPRLAPSSGPASNHVPGRDACDPSTGIRGPPALASPTVTNEKLWRYTRLSRIWARTLVVVGILVFAIGFAMQIGDSSDAFESWVITAFATVVPSILVFCFLLRGWMGNGGLPS